MTDEEFADAISGLRAYDCGATDSGIRDEVLRMRVMAELHRDDAVTMRRLSAHASELLKPPYSLEDVKQLIEWLEDRMEFHV